MQANWCGTLTEQKRHKMGWVKSAERKSSGLQGKCGDCAHHQVRHGSHCKLGDFATRAGCSCAHYATITAKDI